MGVYTPLYILYIYLLLLFYIITLFIHIIRCFSAILWHYWIFNVLVDVGIVKQGLGLIVMLGVFVVMGVGLLEFEGLEGVVGWSGRDNGDGDSVPRKSFWKHFPILETTPTKMYKMIL